MWSTESCIYKLQFSSCLVFLLYFSPFGLLLGGLFKPKDEVFLPVYDHFVRIADSDAKVLKISIQIGLGDKDLAYHNHEIDLTTYEPFFECVKQIEL